MTSNFSFRDPDGRLFKVQDRILRVVAAEAALRLESILVSSQGEELVRTGEIIPTRRLEGEEAADSLRHPLLSSFCNGREMAVFEHDPITIATFPFEWAPEMLRAAGELTLKLASRLIHIGVGIKDATPFNVLFEGPQPVFIDVLSFEDRDPLDPTWLPYAQFVRTFLLPLFLSRHNGLDLRQVFLASREGIEPAQAYRLISSYQRVTPPFLGLASMPTWLSGKSEQKADLYRPQRSASAERARFVLDHLLSSAAASLRRAAPDPARETQWTSYATSEHTTEYTSAKRAAVASILDSIKPAAVLDVGCNTGEYSIAAAESGARVVAIDYDPAVAGRLWTAAVKRKLNILPIVANLAQPSPALGWLNSETPSLLDRLEGRFDCVFMLAVIHHLLVTERVPLEEVAGLAARLTTSHAVIEFVGPEDEHFIRIARGRDSLHAGLSAPAFEEAISKHFSILSKQAFLGGKRCLYLLRKI